MNAIEKQPFGNTDITRVTLTNGQLTAAILTYGATVQSLCFDGKDVVLGFDTPEGYRACTSYQGATVGRYAGRIADGSFSLNGTIYHVGCNERPGVHLHGGTVGFNQKIWTITDEQSGEEPSVSLSYTSPDGEMGYPGTLTVTVTFTVTKENALRIAYHAETDKDTLLNLTNHSYFNLNGFDGGDILDTELTICSDRTLIVNRMLPTGAVRMICDTPFDFQKAKPIGRDIDADDEQMRIGGGYDHSFLLGEPHTLHTAAIARSPRSGITLTCLTEAPSVHLYTGNFIKEKDGKGGIPLYTHQGFCLEAQWLPDSPHFPQFPTTVLHAGESFDSITEYRLSR